MDKPCSVIFFEIAHFFYEPSVDLVPGKSDRSGNMQSNSQTCPRWHLLKKNNYLKNLDLKSARTKVYIPYVMLNDRIEEEYI